MLQVFVSYICMEYGNLYQLHSSIILLDHNMTAKKGDFGFARLPKIPEGKSFIRTTETCGTTGYMAPEFERGELGEKVDVFGFGVVSVCVGMHITIMFNNNNYCWYYRLHWNCTQSYVFMTNTGKFLAL